MYDYNEKISRKLDGFIQGQISQPLVEKIRKYIDGKISQEEIREYVCEQLDVLFGMIDWNKEHSEKKEPEVK